MSVRRYPQIDDKTVQGVGRIYLGHRSFEDGKPDNIETLKEYLADGLAGWAG